MYQESPPIQTFGLAPQGISTARVPPLDAEISRKRSIPPLDRTLFPTAHRAIQPRPPLSSGSYGPEGASRMQLAPGLEPASAGEPPRKRGRPNKAETERRKAAAHARGEVYPPPRRSGVTRPRNAPTPSGAGSVTSDGPVLSPKPAIHSLETKAMETASVEMSGNAGGLIEARRERPVEDPPQEQMESASVLASTQGELRPQVGTERTLPPLQSIQLGFGDTPRTIPGAAGARSLGPPLLSYAEATRSAPSGAGTSNSGRQRGLSLEILAGRSGTQETTRRESGPSESGT